MTDWIRIRTADDLPPVGLIVDTKIDDSRGARNEQPLKRGGSNGALWVVPDGSMYVYYAPSHWRRREPRATAAR